MFQLLVFFVKTFTRRTFRQLSFYYFSYLLKLARLVCMPLILVVFTIEWLYYVDHFICLAIRRLIRNNYQWLLLLLICQVKRCFPAISLCSSRRIVLIELAFPPIGSQVRIINGRTHIWYIIVIICIITSLALFIDRLHERYLRLILARFARAT